jgi:hypothetical protein
MHTFTHVVIVVAFTFLLAAVVVYFEDRMSQMEIRLQTVEMKKWELLK